LEYRGNRTPENGQINTSTLCSRILNQFVNLFSMIIPFYEDFASVTVYNWNNAIRPNQWEFGYGFTSRM